MTPRGHFGVYLGDNSQNSLLCLLSIACFVWDFGGVSVKPIGPQAIKEGGGGVHLEGGHVRHI